MEDYFSIEYRGRSKNQFEDIIAPPAPATLTEGPSPRSIPSSYDEDRAIPRQPRIHRRSLTALLPFRTSRTNSASPQRSPVKEKLGFDFVPTLTDDKDGQIKIADRSKGSISDWFSGSSTPVVVGIPIDESEQTIIMSPPSTPSHTPSPDRVASKLRKRSTVTDPETVQQQPTKATTASTSRFSFFSSKTAAPKQYQIPSELSDELLTLDIRGALFPTGRNEPFSPSAFKNLVANAEGLLNKLQTAYKVRTLSLHKLAAEREAQTDELEEAETRVRHLKMQLEEMAQRVMAHEEEMKNVLGELVKEKQARAEEKEAREKSISLIKLHPASPSEEGSAQSEDLEVDIRQMRRPWRRSDGTIHSDTCSESDDESGGSESVFSRCMSPSLASISEASTPEVGQAVFVKVVNVGSPKKAITERPKPVQQASTFQKIMKGISNPPAENVAQSGRREGGDEDELGMADEGCRNCRGGKASVAWDTVGLLRAENKGLKERVAGLETAVEGALDLVSGLRW